MHIFLVRTSHVMTARVANGPAAKDYQVLRDSQNSVISPSCPYLVCLSVIFPWLLPPLPVLCHDPQPRQLLWLVPEVTPASLLDGVECLAVFPIRLETH